MIEGVGVELKGDIVVARIRGAVTSTALEDLHERLLVFLRGTIHGKVLYDALEMDPPTVELTLMQQRLAEAIHESRGRVAVLVPSTRVAFLARIAFGEGEHRVFYNDLASAVAWLNAPRTDKPA
ncbi:MAG: STAS/SEC14 domain-containing protein [Vicinamibacterales bacterium]